MIDIVLFDDGEIYHRPTISDLYRHCNYSDPVYSDWRYWYAWYPVVLLTWAYVPELSRYIKVKKLAWLTGILKRSVVDHHKTFKKVKVQVHYEYTTMENALRFS